ncbi:NERD domain-containing protein [Oceanobacillus halotolerans]|uniref:NERD domain-containing protein n=1 Tax=Oceanobacillus halotolerans TaxID=2663380 RepID=UPI0013D9BD50|nr:NERD domain-containing protein [Oceanobacillus halotolerans]
MAQLIKMEDYVSRYEWNIYRYPSQYMRLKKDNWNRLLNQWEKENNEPFVAPEEEETIFSKWKAFRKRYEKNNKVEEEQVDENNLPVTEQELKRYYLDKLFPFQLKWATSTVSEVSFMNKAYERDPVLKYFLQRFPDTFLLLYKPIFSIHNAPVDGEIILVSPLGIEVIYLMEDNPFTTIVAEDDRKWGLVSENKKRSVISPMIALKRTESIIKSILKVEQVTFPVKKVVLSRTNYISYGSEPYNTQIIGKKEYKSWFNEKRKLVMPLKNRQLKVAEALLQYCQTNAVKRPEWEEDSLIFVEEEDS